VRFPGPGLILIGALSVTFMIPSAASAQRGTGSAASPPAVPSFILRGLDQLRADSTAAAIATWTIAWRAPGDSSKALTLLASLQQLHEMAGAPLGYEIVGSESVGVHLRRIYVLLRYDTQPLFAQFVAYSPTDRATDSGWKLVTVTWNTNPTEAWPPSVWSR
jgi:hypothetical protein